MNPNLKDLENDLDRANERIAVLEYMEILHRIVSALLAGGIVLVWTVLK